MRLILAWLFAWMVLPQDFEQILIAILFFGIPLLLILSIFANK